MEEQIKPIRTLALAGLILHTVWTAINIVTRLFPQPFLTLLRSPFSEEVAKLTGNPLLLLMPLISLGVYILLFCLLHGQLQSPTNAAGTLFGMTLGAVPALSVISFLMSFVTRTVIMAYHDAATLGAYSVLNSGLSYVQIIDSLAFPLLIAAAAMNWQRVRSAAPQQ